MLILTLASIIGLLLALLFVLPLLKSTTHPYFLFSGFIIIQAWFSVQWAYFLIFGESMLKGDAEYISLFLANSALFLPLSFVYASRKNLKPRRFLSLIILVLTSGFATVIMHWLISSPCLFCAFSPENERLQFNLLFQLLLDVSILIGFIFLFYDHSFKEARNRKSLHSISLTFAIFYINDIIVLASRYLAKYNYYTMQTAMWVEVIIYFIFSMGVLYLGILVKRRGNEVSIAKPKKYHLDPKLLSADWITLKDNCKDSDLYSLIETIEPLDQLSKTEKLYLFISQFDDLSTKMISEILCVSPRTVETNKYRLKKKLQQENILL